MGARFARDPSPDDFLLQGLLALSRKGRGHNYNRRRVQRRCSNLELIRGLDLRHASDPRTIAEFRNAYRDGEWLCALSNNSSALQVLTVLGHEDDAEGAVAEAGACQIFDQASVTEDEHLYD